MLFMPPTLSASGGSSSACRYETTRADAIVREDAIVRPRAGGESVRVVGLHDSRLRRDETGTWRIARDVSTLDGPPTPLAVHRFDLRGG